MPVPLSLILYQVKVSSVLLLCLYIIIHNSKDVRDTALHPLPLLPSLLATEWSVQTGNSLYRLARRKEGAQWLVNWAESCQVTRYRKSLFHKSLKTAVRCRNLQSSTPKTAVIKTPMSRCLTMQSFPLSNHDFSRLKNKICELLHSHCMLSTLSTIIRMNTQ